jgi:GT2 family glycosyltransferase
MNNDCINSIISSTYNYYFNIYLIETNQTNTYVYEQANVKIIKPNEEFNYNRFINIGLSYCKSEWVLITNNDTIYTENFVEYMLNANEFDENLLSMSPMDDTWIKHYQHFNKNTDVYYGYRVSYELTGWSIFLKRSILNIIGNFDEQFSFFYQDDDYAKTLLKYGIKHALVTKSKVTHLLSKSHNLIDDQNKYNEMTNGMSIKFKNKWG